MSTGTLVILSGGQDSTTCLYWARERFFDVRALTIDYGQRHRLEIMAATKVAQSAGVAHEIISVGRLLIGSSPLVNLDEKVGTYERVEDLPGGVEPTFIPGRNLLFLLLAANRAAAHGIRDLVTGVCEEDYGGYPDCRDVFVKHMAVTLGLGFYGESDHFTIHTPLMSLSKKDTVLLAQSLGCLEALAWTHTCYQGQFPPCQKCHACHLRARGFAEAEIEDPLVLRAVRGG